MLFHRLRFAWQLQPRLNYYGSSETFVFRAIPEFEVYRSKGFGNHYQLAARDSLAVGGSGAFALWLDSEFEHGVTHTSPTFGNPPLASERDFVVISVEIWGFTSRRSHRAAELSAERKAKQTGQLRNKLKAHELV